MRLASKWPVKVAKVIIRSTDLRKLQAFLDSNWEQIIQNYRIIRIDKIGPRHGRCYESFGRTTIELCTIAIEFPIWEKKEDCQVKLEGFIKAIEKIAKIFWSPPIEFEPISVWDDGYPYERVYCKLQRLKCSRQSSSTNVHQ